MMIRLHGSTCHTQNAVSVTLSTALVAVHTKHYKNRKQLKILVCSLLIWCGTCICERQHKGTMQLLKTQNVRQLQHTLQKSHQAR